MLKRINSILYASCLLENALAEQVRISLSRDISFSTSFTVTPLHTRRISPTTCPARPTQSKIFIQGGPEEENRKTTKIKTKDLPIIIMYHNASLKAIISWTGCEELIIMPLRNFHFVMFNN